MIDPNQELSDDELETADSAGAAHWQIPSYVCLDRVLTAAEEIDLCQRAQAGDEDARRQMMEGNIRLVLSLAKRYNRCRSMTFADIVQEGIIGLLLGIEKFDTTRGNRFSTYATYWIRQSIVRAIEKTDRMIRLPTYGCNSEWKVRHAYQRLTDELGRNPTVEEVAEATELSRTIVQGLLNFSHEPLSLDLLSGAELDMSILDAVPDANAVDPLKETMVKAGIESLEELLRCLRPRERTVIEYRFGLRDGRTWTLREVAELLQLSREGVRVIQTRSLNKIKQYVQKQVESNPDLPYLVDMLSDRP
jgi:RNA polymerase primary sigma factor